VFPSFKEQYSKRTAQLVPKLLARTEFGAVFLIMQISQLKNLMDKKSEHIEKKKNHGQILLPMAEVVFNMIALIFKRVKPFVFNFPACPAAFNQLDHIIFIDDNIGHPAVAVGELTMLAAKNYRMHKKRQSLFQECKRRQGFH